MEDISKKEAMLLPKQNFDSGLACLMLLARLHELPANPEGLRHLFGRPGQLFEVLDILRAAKEIGLKAREIDSDWERLRETKLPCILRNKDGRYVILARYAEDKVLIHDPREGSPKVMLKDAFLEDWNGKLILATRRARLTDTLHSFDISWFIPAMFKRSWIPA